MAKYQVRVWDAFYNTWVMIPEDFTTELAAINRAYEVAPYFDCGEDGTQEVQIWIECLGGTAWQMIGYVEYTETDEEVPGHEGLYYWDYVFVESFS